MKHWEVVTSQVFGCDNALDQVLLSPLEISVQVAAGGGGIY